MPGLTLKLRRGDRVSIGPSVVVSCVKDEQDALVLAIEAPGLWDITRHQGDRVSDTGKISVDKNRRLISHAGDGAEASATLTGETPSY